MVRVVDGEPCAGPALGRDEAGAQFVVDSTLAPPVVCRPLGYGADLVLHSATESAGIDPGAVRFSIGLEDAGDLISDACVALDSLGRP